MTPASDAAATQVKPLEITGLSKSFGGVHAVRNVSLTLEKGQVLGVIGPNGAGKTSLVNTISGRQRPTSGSVLLEGREVAGKPAYTLNRRGLARSYQQANVFAEETVEENIARAGEFAGKRAVDVDEFVTSTGLDAVWATRAGALPYGQQKILGLVMTLHTGPSVLLLDEPAAGLELSERFRIDHLVRESTKGGCAVLIVEHDMDLIRRLCPNILVMDSGVVLAQGPTREVLTRPDVLEAYLGTTSPSAHMTDPDQGGVHD
jgi:ABC-type branched-subunit amino acid transport system ATPase component